MDTSISPTKLEEKIDFNELSRRGLVYKINHYILHPIGLSLGYDPETGTSDGAFVSEDGVWEYPDFVIKRNEIKLKNYVKEIK